MMSFAPVEASSARCSRGIVQVFAAAITCPGSARNVRDKAPRDNSGRRRKNIPAKRTPAATTLNLFETCTAIHLALHANGLALAVPSAGRSWLTSLSCVSSSAWQPLLRSDRAPTCPDYRTTVAPDVHPVLPWPRRLPECESYRWPAESAFSRAQADPAHTRKHSCIGTAHSGRLGYGGATRTTPELPA